MSDLISSRCTAIVPLFSHSSLVWLVIYARCQTVNYDLLVVMNVHSVSTCLLQQKHVFSWVLFFSPAHRKKVHLPEDTQTRQLMFTYSLLDPSVGVVWEDAVISALEEKYSHCSVKCEIIWQKFHKIGVVQLCNESS